MSDNQPIVRLDTQEVVGFEALCRMMTKSGDIIAAANFHEATKDAHVAAESVYLGQRDHVVVDEFKALGSRGLRVALDDFGTGFASLTHLVTVPVDIIKIDRSFVERLVSGDVLP